MSSQPVPPSPRNLVLFALTAIIGCGVDLSSKQWIFQRLGMPAWGAEPIWLVPNVFSLTTSLNEGALFGMGQRFTPLFAGLSVIAAAGIIFAVFRLRLAATRFMALVLGMILAGILGNLYDRLGLPGLLWNYPVERIGQPVYAVRDWLHFKIDGVIDWPVFNIADSLLVCGAAAIVLTGIFTSESTSESAVAADGKRPPTPKHLPHQQAAGTNGS